MWLLSHRKLKVKGCSMTNIQLPTCKSNQVCIRTAARSDLPALEWDGELKHFRRLFADAYERVEQGQAVILIAEIPEAGLIGQLFLSLRSGRLELSDGVTRGYIYGVRVRPEYRNHGVGTQLMLAAETELIERRFYYATLNVGQDNPKAQCLYEHLGYRVVAPESGRWCYQDENGQRREVHEPAWRMEKLLLDQPHKFENPLDSQVA
jgi:ribosomal protein S18 acetylase RimI-like enzyme